MKKQTKESFLPDDLLWAAGGHASDVVLNVSVVGPSNTGFLRAAPTGAQPSTTATTSSTASASVSRAVTWAPVRHPLDTRGRRLPRPFDRPLPRSGLQCRHTQVGGDPCRPSATRSVAATPKACHAQKRLR